MLAFGKVLNDRYLHKLIKFRLSRQSCTEKEKSDNVGKFFFREQTFEDAPHTEKVGNF